MGLEQRRSFNERPREPQNRVENQDPILQVRTMTRELHFAIKSEGQHGRQAPGGSSTDLNKRLTQFIESQDAKTQQRLLDERDNLERELSARL